MKKYRMGIYITGNLMQCAIVIRQKKSWRLQELFDIEMPNENIVSSLRQACRALKQRIGQTILCLSSRQVMIKLIYLDKNLTNDEIYLYLRHQAAALFGHHDEHWFFDFERCDILSNALSQSGYYIAATPRQYLSAWLRICRECCLPMYGVDVDALALTRLMPTFEGYQPDQPQALLWENYPEVMLLIAQNGQLIYTKRTLITQGQTVIEILSALLKFFHGLFPQHFPTLLFLIQDHSINSLQSLPIRIAHLNSKIWSLDTPVSAQHFCSLGAAIYAH